MSFYLKDNLSDSSLIDVYWGEELLRTLDKKLFVKELKAIPSSLTHQEFSEAFLMMEVKLAKRKALHLLARKGYLSQELKKKLSVKGISAAAIEQAISYAQEGGYIDDEQEVMRHVRSEVRKGRGPQAILFKLKQKRVPEEQLKKIHEELRRQEIHSLQEWVAKKKVDLCVKDFKQRQKLCAQLMRRGFSAEAIGALFKNDWH